MSLRTPLGRVLGRGAAKEGVHHWWVQRLTAVALAPLAIWFLVSLLSLPSLDYATVRLWLHEDSTALLLMLFVVTAAWHSQLGVRVVIEDYVANRGTRIVALALSNYLHVLAAAAGVFAILKVALGGAA